MDEKPFSACDVCLQPLRKFQDLNLLLIGGFFMSENLPISTTRSSASHRNGLLMIVILAMLTAMEIVLNRFLSVNTWNLKIGFSFIPVVAAAILYGPLAGGCVAALGDFLGAILFPIGPYFAGFTATALLTGIVFGLFLHRAQTPLRIGFSVAINQLILSLFLNTLWIFILNMGSAKAAPYLTILVPRIGQCAILIPVQFLVITILVPALRRVITAQS